MNQPERNRTRIHSKVVINQDVFESCELILLLTVVSSLPSTLIQKPRFFVIFCIREYHLWLNRDQENVSYFLYIN